MTWPGKVVDVERSQCGPDFFEREYGKPCAFSSDWIKEHGHCEGGTYKLEDGALAFTTGPKGFTFGFGPHPGDKSLPSVRFGSGWQGGGPLLLHLALQQDVDETEWLFRSTCYFSPKLKVEKDFMVKGKGKRNLVVELGGSHFWWIPDGFTLSCLTPGAKVKIWNMKLAPTSADIFFRKSFTLPEKPVLAHASFMPCANYDLRVNGKVVDSGVPKAGTIKNVDLAPYLVKGENTISFRKRFITSSDSDPSLLFESVAVGRDGHVTHIVGDDSWRASTKADGDWVKPRLSTYSIPMADGKQVASGIEPKHMGMLDAAPTGRQYPVFDIDETPAFLCRLPAGVKGKLLPRLDIFKAGTKDKVESLEAPSPKDAGDFTTYEFLPKVREPGPYRLEWTLLDTSGKALENRREELVIVGPVPQDKLPLARFEAELAKRMKLVAKIDCTAAPLDSEFLDHAGMYNAALTNKGKVVSADGMTYRETGSGSYDYFSYRLHGLKRGEPYIVEVVVPDNRDRLVHSGVVETYPMAMGWNPSNGGRGWFSTTGSCLTGRGVYPLTNRKLALRYVYHPGSMAAAVVVMSGLRDAPAAACEINVYQVEGGLPALELPPTARTFGQHNERFSTMAVTMASDNPREATNSYFWVNGHRDGWANWYKALERKVKWLRYQGQNMAVEGIYMYGNVGGYPSVKDNPYLDDGGLDIPNLMLRMYAKNGIRCFLGVEYNISVSLKEADTVTDRRMREESAPSAMMVDREGRQQLSVNFLNPMTERSILDTLGEIHDRYQGIGKADGIFLVAGNYWVPAFSDRVGYDDLTCDLFEKETGVKLSIDAADTERFQKRHALLNGDHQALWREWRALKVRDFLKKLSARMGEWKVVVAPEWYNKADVFGGAGSNRRDRGNAMEKALNSLSLPLDLYSGQHGPHLLAPLQEVDWSFGKNSLEDDLLPFHGWNSNPGSRTIMKRLDAMYLSNCLNEIDCPANAAKRWLFNHTTRAAFDVRGAGDNCMHRIVDAIRDHTPKDLFVAWLDCNLVTAHGEQERRFAKAFLSTPEADFQPLPEAGAKGITAQTAVLKDGSTCLRLVNDSPYPVSGHFSARAKAVRDLVFDADLRPGLLDHDYQIEMRPNDIRIYKIAGLRGQVNCDFAFPGDVAASLKKEAEHLLAQRKFLEDVPGDMVARLYAALGSGDAYALHATLDDFEVASKVKLAKRELAALDWQAKLLEDLEKTGAAQIDCGSASLHIDPKGRRWLPDQTWIGCGAYGNENASFADRGAMAIANTDSPRPYQTEAYGDHVFYRIPVPNGNYNFILHTAETYEPIKRAGVREFSVKFNGQLWEKKVDPFADAGGFAKAVTLTENNVRVSDGQLVLEFLGGVGVQGIEIEKAK